MTTDSASVPDPAAAALHYYELVDRDDIPGLVGLFAPDATYHRPGYEPMVGHAGLTAFYRGQRVIRSGRHTVHTTVTQGTNVAVSGEFHGVLRDGKPVDLRFADFFVIGPDGRFARRDTFFFAPLA
jgi:ketosteroid isomerase-like protein